MFEYVFGFVSLLILGFFALATGGAKSCLS